MRLLISFLLSLIIYLLIITFLIFFLFPKHKKEQKVYIHTAIIAKKAKINSNANKNTIKPKKEITKIKKSAKTKKTGSKTNLTHGGEDIGFNDIFKNVNYNVNTKKIKIKKQLDMSRLKGIERNLKKIKKISFNVNFIQNSGSKLTKEEINDIISQKLSQIWDNVSTMPSDYAKIQVISNNGNIIVNILESNLATDKQTELINEIKKLKFDKNFDITVLFQVKGR